MIITKKLKEDLSFAKDKIIYYLEESLFGKYRLLFYLGLILLIINIINLKIGSLLINFINHLFFIISITYLFPAFYLNKIHNNLKENIKNFFKVFFSWLITFSFYQIIFLLILTIFVYFYISNFNQILNANFNVENVLSVFIIQPIYFITVLIVFLMEIYLIVFLPLIIVKNSNKSFFSLIGKSIVSIKEFFNFKVIILTINILISILILSKLEVSNILLILTLIYEVLVYYLFFYLTLFLYYHYFNKVLEKKDEKEKINILSFILLIIGLFLIFLKSLSSFNQNKTDLLISLIFLLFSFPFAYLMLVNFVLFLIFLLSI